jgi:hypothetical protein
VSFAGYHTALVGTRVISCRRLQRISIRESCHVFSWCFCQLETIDKDVIYKQVDGIYWEQSLICLVELKGTHRYKNCPVLQRIMPKMRNEGLSEADRKTLNSKVIDGNNVNMQDRRIPASLRSIMPNDAASISMCSDRISRNTTLSAHPITYRKCDCHKVPLSFEHMKVFFEKCSEAVVTSSRSKHLDPILCHLVSASSSMVCRLPCYGTVRLSIRHD